MSVPLLVTGIVILSLIAAGQYMLARRAKRTEASLREAGKLFRAVMDNAPFEIILKDAEGRYVQVNKTWERLYGYSNKEAKGKTVREVIPDEYTVPLTARDAEVLRWGKTIESEDKAAHPDGTVHDFFSVRFPIPGSDGQAEGLGLISADITGRRLTERALRKREEQLRTITDNLPVLIVRWDRDMRYRFANRPAEQWYSRPASEIVGKTIPEVFGEKAYETVRWAIETGLSGETIRFEQQLAYPDGVTRDVEIAYIPDRAADGEVLGCFALVQDVSDRKNLEAELLRKERLAAMGQLTGTVAHELRNPLGAVAISLGVIRQKTVDSELGLERALDRAGRAMRRCEAIITELLDFARARGLQPQSTSLDNWLAELLDEYEMSAGVSLSRELQCAGVEPAIDRDELRRAVINLLDNARDSMASIEDDNDDSHILAVSTRIEGARAEIVVADNGPGIPADTLPHIMEPLFSTKSFGTGLGLPTVKRIMEEHGGGIEIESNEGKGVQATLWLPVGQ
ncbi:MAG: PAS domain-containing protein [Proteobacteria bacterium]|nr:PAS domain-containing protein [Pseudomonadota bacterium]